MMVQVYLLLILALSPFSLYLPPYYLLMCYMCLPCLKTLFWSLPFVFVTLFISCFLTFFFLSAGLSLGVTLVRGQRRDGVYYLPKSVLFRSFALVLSSSVRSSFSIISMWHSRLGHPSLHIFRKFMSILNISFPSDHLCSFSCTSCNINKNYSLPFAQSSVTFSSPFDVIFSNVWTSPVSSFDSFHYYVIFVNHYTIYMALPITSKI